jgi:hypothetical protein
VQALRSQADEQEPQYALVSIPVAFDKTAPNRQ